MVIMILTVEYYWYNIFICVFTGGPHNLSGSLFIVNVLDLPFASPIVVIYR